MVKTTATLFLPIMITLTMMGVLPTDQGQFSLSFYTLILLFLAVLNVWNTMELSSHLVQTRKMSLLLMIAPVLALVAIMYTGKLILIFIAWQTLAITTLLLPNMYYSGTNVIPATLRTFFCNQVGSIGLMVTYYYLVKKFKALEDSNLEPSELMNPDLLESAQIYLLTLPTLLFIPLLLATANLAHLCLNRGLVMTMDIPTPVSTFIHTVVVMMPTTLLLLRFYPTFSQDPKASTICLFFGAGIMLYSATNTLIQSNLPKIINYPASGQLGLVMLAMGLNLPYLALFYTCIFMIVKPTLSLCSDLIMHPSGEKDIRNLQEIQPALPIIGISAGSLILMLAPLIIPLCFKDTLIQAADMSWINLTTLLLALMATIFTMIYNARLIYIMIWPLLKTPKFIHSPEESRVMGPMIRLTSALVLTTLLIPPLSAEGHLTALATPGYMKLAILISMATALALAFLMTTFHWSCLTPRIPYLWVDSDPSPDLTTPPRVLHSIQDLVKYLTEKAPEKTTSSPYFPFHQPVLPQRIRISQLLLVKMLILPILLWLLLMSLD